MLSDTLCDAICEIEEYQRNYPDIYDACKDHVEIVKEVMGSLMSLLDQFPRSDPANVADTLSDDQKAWWRVTCEANIARWVTCLRLLGPVAANDLVTKLADAIERQNAMQEDPDRPRTKRYLAIGFHADHDLACSTMVDLDPRTVGDTPGTKCEAAQSAADQAVVLHPALAFGLDRLWLVQGLAVVGDWRRGEHFDFPELDGVEHEDVEPLSLRCLVCGEVWRPQVGNDGLLPETFAICPKGCNRRPEE